MKMCGAGSAGANVRRRLCWCWSAARCTRRRRALLLLLLLLLPVLVLLLVLVLVLLLLLLVLLLLQWRWSRTDLVSQLSDGSVHLRLARFQHRHASANVRDCRLLLRGLHLRSNLSSRGPQDGCWCVRVRGDTLRSLSLRW
jgi:hypothetical protein